MESLICISETSQSSIVVDMLLWWPDLTNFDSQISHTKFLQFSIPPLTLIFIYKLITKQLPKYYGDAVVVKL